MTNIFDCSSTENYLCEILEYSLNATEVSIDNLSSNIWLASIIILKQEYQIEIVYSTEVDIQFGYKIICNAIDLLENEGVKNIASDNFTRLIKIYKSLIDRVPLVYEPPLIGWFFPGKSYRMAILYGLIKEIEMLKKIEFILPT
jgi:hypothetical protein